jgi:hypothetical protein
MVHYLSLSNCNLNTKCPTSRCFIHSTKESYLRKVAYFRPITIHNFSIVYQIALVSRPRHKFVRPPYCYYWMQEVQKEEDGVASSRIKFIQNCITIGQLSRTFFLKKEDSKILGTPRKGKQYYSTRPTYEQCNLHNIENGNFPPYIGVIPSL